MLKVFSTNDGMSGTEAGGILVGVAGVITAFSTWLRSKSSKDTAQTESDIKVKSHSEAMQLIELQQQMLESYREQAILLQKSLNDKMELLSDFKTRIAVLELKVEECELVRKELRSENLILKEQLSEATVFNARFASLQQGVDDSGNSEKTRTDESDF